jgi:hypothetical protein
MAEHIEHRTGTWESCATAIIISLNELRLPPRSCISIDAHNNSADGDAIISAFYKRKKDLSDETFVEFGYYLQNSKKAWETQYGHAQDFVDLLFELNEKREREFSIISVTSSCNSYNQGMDTTVEISLIVLR